jgi:hypothetical protein
MGRFILSIFAFAPCHAAHSSILSITLFHFSLYVIEFDLISNSIWFGCYKARIYMLGIKEYEVVIEI